MAKNRAAEATERQQQIEILSTRLRAAAIVSSFLNVGELENFIDVSEEAVDVRKELLQLVSVAGFRSRREVDVKFDDSGRLESVAKAKGSVNAEGLKHVMGYLLGTLTEIRDRGLGETMSGANSGDIAIRGILDSAEKEAGATLEDMQRGDRGAAPGKTVEEATKVARGGRGRGGK